MKSWILGVSAATLLSASVLGCASDGGDLDDENAALTTDEEFETAEHRWRGRGRSAGTRDGGISRARDGGTWQARDGGKPRGDDRDSPPSRGGRDGGAEPRPGRDRDDENDEGTDAPIDAGRPASGADAGVSTPTRPTTPTAPTTPTTPTSPTTPPAGDTVRLPDGGVIQLDTSCPNLSALGQTVVGCCLPEGQCGLSTHLIDFPGVPKACGSYEQAKMLDPSFSLPARSCTPAR